MTQTFQPYATEIPLNLIDPHPKNPRKIIREETIQELAQSIKEKGLLQNLIVTPDQNGRYLACGGGRRRRALTLLAERGEIGWDFPVRTLVAPESDALLLGIIENAQREDVSALEEAEAICDLHNGGMGAEEIEAKLGKGKRYIKERMALWQQLSEQAKELLRTEQLNLAQALRLTLLDTEQQTRFLEAHGTNWAPTLVNAYLSKELIDPKRVKFTRAEYEAAGGKIVAPLLGEDIFYASPEIVVALQKAKAEEIAKTLEASPAFSKDGIKSLVIVGEFPRTAYRDGKSGEDRVNLVIFNPETLGIEFKYNQVDIEAAKQKAEQAKSQSTSPTTKPQSQSKPAAPSSNQGKSPLPVSSVTNGGRDEFKHYEALANRRGVESAGVRHGMALVVLALLGGHNLSHGLHLSVSPGILPALDKSSRKTDILGKKPEVEYESTAADLLKLAPEELDQLFLKAVGSFVGSVPQPYAVPLKLRDLDLEHLQKYSVAILTAAGKEIGITGLKTTKKAIAEQLIANAGDHTVPLSLRDAIERRK